MRRRWRAAIGQVTRVLLTLALTACAGRAAPSVLQAVALPTPLRPGSPLEVTGLGLAGATLVLQGPTPSAEMALAAVAGQGDGSEVATAQVPDVAAWAEGARIRRACLRGPGLAGFDACVTLDRAWSRALPTGEAALAPADVRGGEPGCCGVRIALGRDVEVHGDGLLLPGEGTAVLEVEQAGVRTAVPIETRLAWGRGRGRVRAAPSWLGIAPGPRQLASRLVQVSAAGEAASPWTPVLPLELVPPWTAPLSGPLRRGSRLPLAIEGVPADGGWQVQWSGTWRDAAGAAQTWGPDTPRVQHARSADQGAGVWLDSAFFLTEIEPLQALLGPSPGFEGAVRLRLEHGAETWLGPPILVQWPLQPTVQIVVLRLGPGFEAGLAHLGLQAFADRLRPRVLALTAGYFAGSAVQVVAEPPAHAVEWLRLDVLDRDPNGLGLIGADSSPGKDVGNRRLDERLGGYDAAAAVALQAPYGGVFLNGFLHFSAKLHPTSSIASADFDALFGPFSPTLGGTPAKAQQPPEPTLEVLAQLVAHTAAHEIGHALGLAAGTEAYHHAGDHPGWIMDAGAARPFAERARLAGAVPPTWGPVDGAYLATILPAP